MRRHLERRAATERGDAARRHSRRGRRPRTSWADSGPDSAPRRVQPGGVEAWIRCGRGRPRSRWRRSRSAPSRSNRSARCGGQRRAGRRWPASTASGNLAGWAVARHDHRHVGRRRRASRAAAEADRGVRVDEHRRCARRARRMVGRGAVVVDRGRRTSARRAGRGGPRSTETVPSARKRAMQLGDGGAVAAVAARTAGARGCDDTWMSMLGLSVGCTSPIVHRRRWRGSG